VIQNSRKTLLTVSLMLLALCAMHSAKAQTPQKKRVIQLSGVVIGEDSVTGVPGIHVYVPKAGRGTTTNRVGFFSMPVLTGDEIVISSIGYQRQFFTVPDDGPEYQTIIISLVEDTTLLPEIVYMPYATEEIFKQAVLALNAPVDDHIDKRNMNDELLALMLKTTPMDGYQNSRYYLNQWASSTSDKFQPVTNPFLNPFNWVKFFNQIKKDKKK